MSYYAIDSKTGELKHWKYIKKERVNGKWRYWYEDPDAEKEKDKNLIDPDQYDIMQVGDTAYARKKGTKGPFTSSKGDTYEVKKSNDLFDSTLKTQVGANLSSRTTHTVKYEGKITQGREKLKKQIEKGRKWFEDLFD